jgi:hypothetical protein
MRQPALWLIQKVREWAGAPVGAKFPVFPVEPGILLIFPVQPPFAREKG